MRDRWRHKDMCISMGYSAQSPSSTPKSTKRKMEATLSLQRVKVGVRLTRHKLDSHQDESSLWYAASWARARGLLESSFALTKAKGEMETSAHMNILHLQLHLRTCSFSFALWSCAEMHGRSLERILYGTMLTTFTAFLIHMWMWPQDNPWVSGNSLQQTHLI